MSPRRPIALRALEGALWLVLGLFAPPAAGGAALAVIVHPSRTEAFDVDSLRLVYLKQRRYWGDGSPTREFLYVDDCARALQLAADRYDGAAPVNLGTGVETSIRELAETIADLTGFAGEIVWDTSMPNGQPRRKLDASRARELFGFEAETSLRDGLEKTIAWFRERAGASLQ